MGSIRLLRAKRRLQAQQRALISLATAAPLLADKPDTFCWKFLRTIVSTLGACEASIWSVDEDRAILQHGVLRHGASFRRAAPALLVPRHCLDALLQMLSTQKVFVSNNIENSTLQSSLELLISESHHRSIILCSASSTERLEMFIVLSHSSIDRCWSEDEKQFCQSAASLFVTAQLLSQQHQTKNELFLKSSAIDSAQDGIAVLDEQELFIFVNQAHARLYGYESPEMLVGKHWSTLYEPDEVRRFQEIILPRFLKAKSVTVEAIGRKRDGSLFPQEVSLTCIDARHFICVVRDTTIRKQVERRAEQMALFATLSPSPIIRFSLDGRILVANPAATEIMGLRQNGEEVLQEIIPSLTTEDLARCVEENEILYRTVEFGDHIFQLILRGVSHLGFGHLYGNDISELIHAQQEIQNSENFLRNVIDTNPSLIFVKDAKGRFALANEAVARAYGTTVEDLLGKTDQEFNGDASQVKRFRDDDLDVLRTGQDKSIQEERLTFHSGETHWLQTVKKALRMPGRKDPLVLGVATDVTERKILQEQLAQSQKLEAVGQLAGGIAHDFNNLLTGILGCANLLSSTFRDQPQVTELAGQIEKTTERAAELTSQLLGFARRGKHRNVCIDIHSSIEEVRSLLGRTIESDIHMSADIAAEDLYIQGDPVQIQQVLLNICLNARDSMRPTAGGTRGGSLSIMTRSHDRKTLPLTIQRELSGDAFVEISVQDTGCGIPRELQARVFEPFYTTKDDGRGSGMGLSMAYGIVRNHGGAIGLESVEGVGTTFSIFLPTTSARPLSLPLAKEMTKHVSQGRILLVDDNATVRDVATRMLQELGFEVLTAQDGVEAYEYFRNHSQEIDLLILDMIMPRMGARECFPLMKQIAPNVPALLSTGYVNNHEVQNILDLGMAGFIQKPFQLRVLARKVTVALHAGAAPSNPTTRRKAHIALGDTNARDPRNTDR